MWSSVKRLGRFYIECIGVCILSPVRNYQLDEIFLQFVILIRTDLCLQQFPKTISSFAILVDITSAEFVRIEIRLLLKKLNIT